MKYSMSLFKVLRETCDLISRTFLKQKPAAGNKGKVPGIPAVLHLIVLCACMFVIGGCAASVRDSLAYRPGVSVQKNPSEIALIVKTNVPLATLVRVFRIDNDEFLGTAGGRDYQNYLNLQRIEFFELTPGKHTLVVTIDGSLRTTTGNPMYYITKQMNLTVHVEAGKQYVLWGDVWKDGSKVGLSAVDDFCINDYCTTQISSRSRLDNAHECVKSRIAEYWLSRDQLAAAPLVH